MQLCSEAPAGSEQQIGEGDKSQLAACGERLQTGDFVYPPP